MNRILRWMIPVVVTGAAVWSLSAQAQAPVAVGAPEKSLAIKNVFGLEANARLRTPAYDVNGGSKIVRATGSVIREWVQVVAEYATAPDVKNRWLNQVSFQFYVLTVNENRETKQKEYMLFRGQVSYADVDRNRRDSKWATMYLRPTVLARYGQPIAVAVEATVDGRLVDTKFEVQRQYQAMLSQEKEWWKNPRLTVKDGYLLKASDTPFAFLNYDDYEETVR